MAMALQGYSHIRYIYIILYIYNQKKINILKKRFLKFNEFK